MKKLLLLAILSASLNCPGANLTGTITYSGSQPGPVRITASQSIPGNKVLKLSGAGTVRIDALTNLSGPEISIQFWYKGFNAQSAVRQQIGGLYIIASWNNGHLTNPDGYSGPVANNITDGAWHHVIMTRKRNGIFAGYVDGQFKGSVAAVDADLPNVGGPVYFGSNANLAEFGAGEMDEIAIWNRALSASEITTTWGLPLATNAPGLVGYWKFDDNSFNDSTTNAFIGTPLGDANIISDDIPNYSQTVVVASPGSYTITNVPAGSGYSVKAFLDANTNTIQEAKEPSGAYAGNPFTVSGNLSGLNMTLTEPPYITQQPQSPPGNRVPLGGNASFSVTALGTPTLTYQWYRDAVPLTNGVHVSGATGTNLQLTSLAISDIGGYGCVISNLQGSVASLAPQLYVITNAKTISGTVSYSGPQLGQVHTIVSQFRSNKVLNLNSVSNQFADTTLTDLSGDALSIEYWFKGSDSTSVVRQQAGPGYISTGWANSIDILSNDGGTSGLSLAPPGKTAADGTWHHVALTWQRNTVNGFVSYLDGEIVQQRNSADNPIPNINDAVRFGSLQGVAEFANGQIDEIAIWSRALTRSEIRTHARNGLTGSEPNLTGYWNFDDGLGQDLSPNGNNVELRNGATIVDAAIPGQGAVYPDAFPGTGAYTITNIPAGSTYVLSAFRDANGNGQQDFYEARGAYGGNPFALNANLSGANMTLQDFTTAISRSGSQVTLLYNLGTLQSATNIVGPWTPVTNASPPSFSTNIANAALFFRAR